MDWLYAGKEFFTGAGSVDFSIPLTRSIILIDIDSPKKKSTWNRAGSFIQVIDLGFIQGVELATSYSKASFSPPLLRFDLLAVNEYRLRFKPVPWLTEFSITVWQNFGE